MTLFKKFEDTTINWNYRIKEKIYKMDSESLDDYIKSMKNIFGEEYQPNLEPEVIYEIVEVYYNNEGKIVAWSDCSIVPWRKYKKRFFRRTKEI